LECSESRYAISWCFLGRSGGSMSNERSGSGHFVTRQAAFVSYSSRFLHWLSCAQVAQGKKITGRKVAA
jgi:hypothetical protein